MNCSVLENLPEVEQLSLFGSTESGGTSQITELLPIESSTRNFGEYPSAGEEYMLSAILVENPPEWSFLSEKALNGILTRASRRGGEVAGLTADCYSWHDRMVASKPSGGGSVAYTMKIRGGCEGGGKGALVQEELSATLATHQDQTLFENRGCFPINTMLATRYKALGRETGLGIGNDGDPQYTITKGHEHAVAYSVGDVPDTAFANAGDTVARTLTARADGSPMIDRGPNIVTQKGK